MSIKKTIIYIPLLITVVLIAFLAFSIFRPLPPIKTVIIFKPKTIVNNQKIVWAKSGNQAIGLVGYKVANQSGSNIPSPVASTIKVLLALSVLSKKPLALDQQGPNIIITPADVANYDADLAQGESVVKVTSGETISEYQALQALLIASANNFADILANWAFGSTPNYLTYANQFAKSIGMSSTTISDDSGYSTSTISDSVDLVALGQKAIVSPVIANIVDEYTATIPVVGKITNYNINLNPTINKQINGIKTGNTTTGGGNYLYSAHYMNYQIVGSIVGATDLNTALSEGPQMLSEYESLINIQTIISKNQVVGYYNLPWGNKIFIYSKTTQLLPVQPNIKYSTNLELSQYQIGGKNIANYLVISNDQKTNRYTLTVENTYKAPSLWWKLQYSLKNLD